MIADEIVIDTGTLWAVLLVLLIVCCVVWLARNFFR